MYLKILNKKIQVPQKFFDDVKKVKTKKTHWRHEKIKYLTEDDVAQLKSWYFPVVWEVVTNFAFDGNLNELSKKLGLCPEEVEFCFNTMVAQGLLQKDEQGRWRTDHEQASTINMNYTTEELRRLQIQLFMQQVRSLTEVDSAIRDHSTIFISGDEKLLNEVKLRIKLFRRSLANYIEKNSTENNQVFQLSVGFSPCLKK